MVAGVVTSKVNNMDIQYAQAAVLHHLILLFQVTESRPKQPPMRDDLD
jgi:hypothetical protein